MGNTPTVGRIVHYVSYGTPGGEFPRTSRAAIVTEVDTTDQRRVGLCVLNPTGMFFHSLADGGCEQREGDNPPGGTWHWPRLV